MPLSEIINVHRYADIEWRRLHDELETYSIDKHVFATTKGNVYRKGWEWTQCIYGLSKLGAINEDARALGVGSGREPVIFWLADRLKEVVSSDLYGNELWSGNNGSEASAAILKDASQFCPRDYATERVRFENADGTALPYASAYFDICWSLSSIEHFGGHNAATKAVQEMARVTKPGGIIAVASEILLREDSRHDEFFTGSDVCKYIINASSHLELVDGMSWELPPLEYLIDQVCVNSGGVHRRRRHVVLNDGENQWTSFILFFRKG